MTLRTCVCGHIDPGSAASQPQCPECGQAWPDKPSGLSAWWRRQGTGLAISASLHGLVLIALALIVFPVLTESTPQELLLSTVTDPLAADAQLEAVTPVERSDSGAVAGADSGVAASAIATALSSGHTIPLSTRIDPTRADVPPQSQRMVPSVGAAVDLTHSFRPVRRSDPQKGGLVQTTSVGGALDGILGHLRGELNDDMLQVIWLLDASISLHIDRQEIASRLVPFYKEMISRPNKRERPFRSSVVAFGARPVILQRSTENAAGVVQAISGMSADPSGLENVFTAVQFSLDAFKGWKGTTVIVLWTDESGDDLAGLEQTIALCRERRVPIHVVGPQSVLGMEQGLQLYTMPETGYSFLLPVKRGPDAALPERLRIPYWFDSLSPPWTQNGAYIGQGAGVYGGPYREGLLAGTGPYALTRLALETGGTFSILQRRGDSAPMAWETQRLYLPDYQEAREIMADVQRSPLRQAVVQAASLTWQADLRPPPRVFFGKPTDEYPFQPLMVYIPAEFFQLQIKSEFPALIQQAQRDLAVIEAALAVMDPIRLETAYEGERSPRWRAWYNLNTGRLLATSVRLAEYAETLRLVLNGVGIGRTTNNLALIESKQYKTGRVAEQRAALAREHLETVIKDHPGTPWALMAQWELQHELGFVVQPREVPMPRPTVGATPVAPIRSGGGAPSLPKL